MGEIAGLEVILQKMRSYCAYQERCHSEIRSKLALSKIYGEQAGQIIEKLLEENYLNEERFAQAFAGGKFRIKNWGKIRIVSELKRKGISAYCIKSALKEIPEEEYHLTATRLFEKKLEGSTEDSFDRNCQKAVNYLQQKGFENDLAFSIYEKYKSA